MSFSEKQASVISRIKSGASVKEICKELDISPTEIYSFLQSTIPSDKSIEFSKLPLSTQIKLLVFEQNYDAAIELCNKEENLENSNIQEQHVKILLTMFEQRNDKKLLQTALEICKKNSSIKRFRKLKNQIENLIRGKNVNRVLTDMISAIYYEDISKEEIENSQIKAWEKALLLICYYEKHNKKNGLSYIKTLKNDYKDDKDKLKILNVLYERLNSKKPKLFDVNIYTPYLNCTFNLSYVKKTKNEPIEEVKELNVKSSAVVQPTPKPKIKVIVKKETQPQTTQNIRYNRYNRNNQNNEQKDSKPITSTTVKEICIKDIFQNEVLEIGKYLYVEIGNIERQKDAVRAWDNFECLINKSINDIRAMKRMIEILKKFQSEGLLPTTTNYDSVKVLKK